MTFVKIVISIPIGTEVFALIHLQHRAESKTTVPAVGKPVSIRVSKNGYDLVREEHS